MKTCHLPSLFRQTLPPARKRLWALTLLAFYGLGTSVVHAQEYSSDGNRWYEIEISAFAISMPPGQIEELSQVSADSLEYLPNLQYLRSASSSFQIDFASEENEFERGLIDATLLEDINPGPMLIQPRAATFRIDDFTRDPFIALDKRFWGFSDDLQRIQSASDYDLLWHGMWRQAMQGKQQTPAIALIGGQKFGLHNELEGSVRFSDSNTRVLMELNLWFNRFEPGVQNRTDAISLPAQALLVPSPENEEIGFGGTWAVSEVWQIQDSKELSTNTYYYLDNPAFGVVLQVRPYVLPSATLPDTEEDF